MLCDFGCGQEAKYQIKNGKWCCSKSPNSCPTNKNKNSEGLSKAHKEGRLTTKHLDKYRNWNKGLTKETSEILRKQGEKTTERLKKMGNKNPFIINSKKRSEISKNEKHSSYKKQSETRKRLYAEGKLFPAKGVGKGKYSYFIYKNKKYLLRSTFEFIFALYLAYKKIDFTYESIRVKYQNSTRISDFEINGKLYEIKGYSGSHVNKVVKAFENNGYKIKVVYYRTLLEIKKYLIRKGINVDKYIDEIKEGHKSKNYFIFDSNYGSYN